MEKLGLANGYGENAVNGAQCAAREATTEERLTDIMTQLNGQDGILDGIDCELKGPAPKCDSALTNAKDWDSCTLNEKLMRLGSRIIENNDRLSEMRRILETLGGTKLA